MIKHGLTALVLAAALALLLPLSGCGAEKSPGEVVKEVFAAYNARDFGKVYDLSSAALQQQSGDRNKAIFLMEHNWPAGTEVVDLKVDNEAVDGDTATVTWSGTLKTPGVPDEPSSATINLVKEDGEWRVAP